MPFPWELNLDRPYRHVKWPFPDQRTRGDTAADNEDRQDTTEGSD
jgi:hypothetical protein